MPVLQEGLRLALDFISNMLSSNHFGNYLEQYQIPFSASAVLYFLCLFVISTLSLCNAVIILLTWPGSTQNSSSKRKPYPILPRPHPNWVKFTLMSSHPSLYNLIYSLAILYIIWGQKLYSVYLFIIYLWLFCISITLHSV